MPQITQLTTDVLVIGAGGAGLRAALAAAAGGLQVAVVSKVPPTRSHTVAAQGGINAALGNRLPDDWRWHMYDTVRGGDWLGDQDAVAFMCERAADAIFELEQMGMPFTRAEDGRIYQRAYGGQYADYGKGGPAYRACAVADRTGHALLHTLYAKARHAGVHMLEECFATDLLMDAHGACRGAFVWRLENGELMSIAAHRTILATGGFGQAWASTTASSICTGDGGGMALRAGLCLQDMEFVQFHPTSLYGTGLLITEGARGEGASLLNGEGERFMERYAPKSMELASRDVIARAMTLEIQAGRGAGAKKDHLLLDLTHLAPEMIRERLPSVVGIARTFGRIDALKEPIPVLPAVHYTMGGIASNAASEAVTVIPPPAGGRLGGGQTCSDDASRAPTPTLPLLGREQIVPGLMVIGEAACNSVHGANRLGCNSLLDLVVFGRAAGEACVRDVRGKAAPPAADHAWALARLEALRGARGGTPARLLRRQVQAAMQAHAGIFRRRELLAEGREKLRGLWKRWREDLRVGDGSLIWNNDLSDALETENLLMQAIVTVESALWREESRGAHWREDFPAREDGGFLVHSVAGMEENGEVQIKKRPVRQGFSGNPAGFSPEMRVY